ncbi:hypothetical protein EMPS_06162 [Entomortierella parvispora]|uniref:Uncharacterized protein n=1 Tax=Entomortierella parvispora TaxID=205924 RepID=A0A9P3HBS2_9FUNG|nr:hypothetical protein EMPS_06162 [Entomortierella parvispora]
MRPSRAVSGSSSAAAAAAVAMAVATASNARFAVVAASATKPMLSSAGSHQPLTPGTRPMSTPSAPSSYSSNVQHFDADSNRQPHRPTEVNYRQQAPCHQHQQQQLHQQQHNQQRPWTEPHFTTDAHSLTQGINAPRFRDDGSGSREGPGRSVTRKLHSYSSSPSSLRLSFVHASTATGQPIHLRSSISSPSTSTSSSSPSSQTSLYQSLLGGLSAGMVAGSPFEEGTAVGTSSVVSKEGARTDYFSQPLSPQSVGTTTPISPNCTSLTMTMSQFSLDQSYPTAASISTDEVATAAPSLSLPNSPPSMQASAGTSSSSTQSPGYYDHNTRLTPPGYLNMNASRSAIGSPFALQPNSGRVVFYESQPSLQNWNLNSAPWRPQQQQGHPESVPTSTTMNVGDPGFTQQQQPLQQQHPYQYQQYPQRPHISRSYSTPSIFQVSEMWSGYQGQESASAKVVNMNEHVLEPNRFSLPSTHSSSSNVSFTSSFSTHASELKDSYTSHPVPFSYQDLHGGSSLQKTTPGPDRGHRFNAAVTRRRSDGLLSRYSFPSLSLSFASNHSSGAALSTDNKIKDIHPRCHEVPGSTVQQQHLSGPHSASISPWSKEVKAPEGNPYDILKPEHPERQDVDNGAVGQVGQVGQPPAPPLLPLTSMSFHSDSAQAPALCWTSQSSDGQEMIKPQLVHMDSALTPAVASAILDRHIGVYPQSTKQNRNTGEDMTGVLSISGNTDNTSEYFGDFPFDTLLPPSVNSYSQ